MRKLKILGVGAVMLLFLLVVAPACSAAVDHGFPGETWYPFFPKPAYPEHTGPGDWIWNTTSGCWDWDRDDSFVGPVIIPDPFCKCDYPPFVLVP